MRCYFMRGDRIEGVTFLKAAPDQELIRQARTLFLARAKAEQFDGFEVWEGDRFIHREDATDEQPALARMTTAQSYRSR